ncbi:MAG: prepilin-type N-terminal cleavage/methylation domain-containing protein [Phycisphaerales bacterium]|jgi:prepilin-type N-terminal cleavage/methylation domain-containing protein
MTRRGFTLIEVLIAIGLLVLLAGLMANFGITLADRRDRITRVGTRVATVSAVFSQLDAALTAADVHGSGVRVSESSLTVTSRRVVADPVLAEFDELSLRFDESGETLTASRSAAGFSLSIPGVQRVRFRAFDGSAWGDFSGNTLPQAVEVGVWFAPPPSSDDATMDDAEFATADSAFEFEDETETPPDRWRVFSLVDTLPEVGS